MRVDARQANYLRPPIVDPRKHKKHNATDEFQKFVDNLWEADEDRAPPGHIELNWQEKLNNGGRPLQPLGPRSTVK